MPWQHDVANIGMELGDDGFPAYREVVVTVMRQSGKTTLFLVIKIDRGYNFARDLRRPQRILYSAQTGKDGREKLLEDEWPLIEASPFRAAFAEPRRAAGSEALVFTNGSRILNLASSDSAGHGKTLDLGEVDEAFADIDDRREQAMIPAMATKPWAQLWIASTMGTDASVYLNRKVERGRANAEAGRTSDVAYFEWSIPETEDIDSPAVWARYMPAYGITITERVVRHARETMEDSEFRRAWGNQRTSSDERVISIEAWAAATAVDIKAEGRVVYGFAVTPEHSHASIAVADRSGRVERAYHDAGTAWALDILGKRASETRARVVLDPAGPAGAFVDELERRKVKVVPLTGRDYAAACGEIYHDIVEGTEPFIRSSDDLSVACGALTRRPLGDAWVWDRKGSGDITPFEAITLARAVAMKPGSGPVFAY
jgi:phage terminase large subunit-like protein